MLSRSGNKDYFHHQQGVLPKGRSLTASAGTKAAVLPKAGLAPQTEELRLQFYQGFNRRGNFPLLSTLTITLDTGNEKIPLLTVVYF